MAPPFAAVVPSGRFTQYAAPHSSIVQVSPSGIVAMFGRPTPPTFTLTLPPTAFTRVDMYPWIRPTRMLAGGAVAPTVVPE